MRGDIVSELRLAAPYAYQVARAIVRRDDGNLKKKINARDLPTLPLRCIGYPCPNTYNQMRACAAT